MDSKQRRGVEVHVRSAQRHLAGVVAGWKPCRVQLRSAAGRQRLVCQAIERRRRGAAAAEVGRRNARGATQLVAGQQAPHLPQLRAVLEHGRAAARGRSPRRGCSSRSVSRRRRGRSVRTASGWRITRPSRDRNEVYVQSFPTAGAKWQVSKDGGYFPRWSRDGKELFYYAPDGRLMAVRVTGDAALEIGASDAALQAAVAERPKRRHRLPRAVRRGARRALPAERPGRRQPPPPITVVLNWATGLKK